MKRMNGDSFVTTPDDMTVVEELMAQRDAVLFGRWGRMTDLIKGTANACLEWRDYCPTSYTQLSNAAKAVVQGVLLRRGLILAPDIAAGFSWNDTRAKDSDEVLDVLDEAIRDAKEQEGLGTKETRTLHERR